MEIHVIASGSKGNSTFVKTKTKNILVDVGISYLRIKEDLAARDIDIKSVDTILITHEHGDHVMGLKTLLNSGDVKEVFLTSGTHQSIKREIKQSAPIKIIKADEPFYLDDLLVYPIMLSHDAKEPVGFVLIEDDKKAVFITDTGYVSESYFDLLRDADFYMLESNHHPFMLMNSNRSFSLKKRILGEKGHLSNEDAIWLINSLVENKKATWVVAHISEECNNILEIEKGLANGLKKPEFISIFFATKKGLKGIIIWLRLLRLGK